MEGVGVAAAVGERVGEDQRIALAAAEGEAGPDELRLAARIAVVQIDQGGQDPLVGRRRPPQSRCGRYCCPRR